MYFIAEAGQHALGVVAGGRRLAHAGLAFGIEPGEQQARLHLGAGHGHVVGDALELLAAVDLQRRAAALGGVDPGAHQPQRVGHATHGALGQRGVADQFGIEGLARQQAGEQTHGGTGIAHVERPGRRLEPVHADAVHGNAPLVRPFDGHAHLAKRLQGGEAVLPFQKALHFGHAFGQGAQHDRAMGDRLVARHANAPGHAATGRGPEGELAVLLHLVFHLITGLVQERVEVVSCMAGTVEDGEHSITVARFHGLTQPAQTGLEVVEGGQHGVAVGGEDVAPHDRVAAGDAGEVAKAAGGVAEDLQPFVLARQGVHQREGEQVRQMAGARQHLVVALHVHLQHFGAAGTPQRLHPGHGGRGGFAGRGEDHLVLEVKLRVRSRHTALLGAGDGMPQHQPCRQLAEGRQCAVAYRRLGAADVGDDHPWRRPAQRLTGQQLGELLHHAAHGQHRHRQHDHAGTFHQRREPGVTVVDQAHLDAARDLAGVRVAGLDGSLKAGGTQSGGQRAAEQPQADEQDSRGVRRHARVATFHHAYSTPTG